MTGDGGEFLRQAAICRAMASPFTARVLEAGPDILHRGPLTLARIAGWPGDRGDAAVGLRFASAFHALARRHADAALVRLYKERDGDFAKVLGDALEAQDGFVADWIGSAPQTNEVGRAAAIMAALMVAATAFPGASFELLELGSSAGLNLNLGRYGYDLGGVFAGSPAAMLRLHPEWRGPPPPDASVRITSARGVDIAPLDVADPAVCDRLRAYCWPDQDARAARLDAAIALAQVYPPQIDRGDAAAWLEQRLAEPQDAGTIRAIFHSIVLQYLPPQARARVLALIADAGKHATTERPLAHVSFEWDDIRKLVQLELTLWPGGTRTTLATVNAHGAWVEWAG
ncbi:DUF2332 domain-containing protein [Sphingomonas japonica]|uniref:DUF2332 domain-containing protein n=1 Tax=Sphingomonas japonica TaxID=511662 RepID=A0ABX0TZL2_9SPHN|nr:DUF2332 family protein [Sphingomonas japonica]NIJ23694.1 hypothetical protein [Sphingomonas japonica]